MYPALAVVEELAERADVLWVGSEGGMEAALLDRTHIEFASVPAAGVHGVGLRALPGNVWRLANGIPAARRILRRFQPDVLFFTGGFVGVPVALAGIRIPKVVYVPDIEPALALRFLGVLAQSIVVTAEASRRFYASGRRVVVSGYPTRKTLHATRRDLARRRLDLDPAVKVLLVFGGSRGARSINEALWGCLPELLQHAHVIHITGQLDWPRVEQHRMRLPEELLGSYRAYAYLHEQMADALAAADLVVSRAGAATLGEYTLLGLPAVLVPYPHAWRYQRINADHLIQGGAAVSIPDHALSDEMLSTVLSLLEDDHQLKRMADASRRMATPEAAQRIAAEIERVAGSKGRARA